MSRRKLNLLLASATLTVVVTSCGGAGVDAVAITLFNTQPAIAQGVPPMGNARAVRMENIWQQVYQQLPNLPQENKYVSKETGKVATDNTLVSRLIRYHVYVRGRPTNFRLDWKLTLADYLGVNEVMEENGYPGTETLRQNPLEGDRAAIARLSRQQRDALAQTLASLFGKQGTDSQFPTASPSPQLSPTPNDGPSLTQPRPGDAQLLIP